MHGGTVGDFVGKPLRTLFTPEAAEEIPGVSTAIDGDAVVSYGSEHLRVDGTAFPVHTEVAPARDEDGAVRYRIAWYDDLTERQAVERRAGLVQRDFEAAFNAAPHGVAIVDPDDLDADLAQVDALLAGEIDSYEMEKRYFTKAGHLIWVLLAVAIVRDEDGSPRHFISQVQDISERKRRAVAEELRLAIAAADTARSCTASLGLCRIHGDVPDAETCFRAVDRAMYRAKSQGRDPVVVGSISERPA